MPAKKSEGKSEVKTKKTAAKKPVAKKFTEVVNEVAQPDAANELDITLEDVFDFCDLTLTASFYNVDAHRDLFMELRKIVDNAYAKRNKSADDEEYYDGVIFNLTTKCLDDESLQDFMGYCYKKGKYDFCLLNYEKYIKWTVLAASRGNAFSLNKLQLFYQNQLEDLLSIKDINKIAELLEVEDERFIYILMKKLSDALVHVLGLYPEEMIKEPETYLEQNDTLMRKFDKAKSEAYNMVKKECEDFIFSIEQLSDEERKHNLEMPTYQEPKEESVEDVQVKIEEEALKQTTSSNRFVKKSPSKKKFRW